MEKNFKKLLVIEDLKVVTFHESGVYTIELYKYFKRMNYLNQFHFLIFSASWKCVKFLVSFLGFMKNVTYLVPILPWSFPQVRSILSTLAFPLRNEQGVRPDSKVFL